MAGSQFYKSASFHLTLPEQREGVRHPPCSCWLFLGKAVSRADSQPPARLGTRVFAARGGCPCCPPAISAVVMIMLRKWPAALPQILQGPFCVDLHPVRAGGNRGFVGEHQQQVFQPTRGIKEDQLTSGKGTKTTAGRGNMKSLGLLGDG